MLLTDRQSINPKSIAFKITLEQFGIPLAEMARASGVPEGNIIDFAKGKEVMRTRILSRLLLAFKPIEAAFYAAMVNFWVVAQSAGIEPEYINWRKEVDITDVYRQAYTIVMDSFKDRIDQAKLSRKIGKSSSHLGHFKSGTKDINQETLRQLEEGFTFEQRMMFLCLVDIFLILGSERMGRARGGSR